MTIYYGLFDPQGAPQAFYNDAVYPKQENGDRNVAIPAAAVEITEEQWQELLSNPRARFIDDEIVFAKPAMPASQYDWGPTLVEVIGQA